MALGIRIGVLFSLLALVACEVAPPTPSSSIEYAWQFNIEFSIEQEAGQDHTARARFYDIAQAYDITGNAGTIELTGGDAAYADDTHLAVETRSKYLSTLRVDYSETIAAGKEKYTFELRRANDERIEASVPIPVAFELDELVESPSVYDMEVTWSPVVDGATMDIHLLPLTDGCLTVVGGGPADIALGFEDIGSYSFDTDVYHSIDHDCTYELIVVRRSVGTASSSWFTEGQELPGNGVHVVGLHTTRATFTAEQR